MRLETQIILEHYLFPKHFFKMFSSKWIQMRNWKKLIQKLEIENMKFSQENSILRNILQFSRLEEK